MVLLTLVAMQFTSLDDFMLVTAMGPQLMESLAISPKQYSLLVSAYSFSAGIAGLIASTMVDRIGRKRAFLGLYAGFVAGTLLCGLAPDYRPCSWPWRSPGRRRGSGGDGAGDHRRRVSPRSAGARPRGRCGQPMRSRRSSACRSACSSRPGSAGTPRSCSWRPSAARCSRRGSEFLPPLRGHLGQARASQPLRSSGRRTRIPITSEPSPWSWRIWFSSYSVIPTILPYLKDNVGVPKANHPLVYLLGGSMTLIATPLVGRLADRHGKLRVYRMAAALSIAILLVLTNLPRVGLALAVGVVASFMVVNAARFVVAMALVNGSVEPPRRGSFLSANSSVQQMAMALGAAAGGWIVVQGDRRRPPALRNRGADLGRLHAPEPLARRSAPPRREDREYVDGRIGRRGGRRVAWRVGWPVACAGAGVIGGERFR